jgi:hypothetical protein
MGKRRGFLNLLKRAELWAKGGIFKLVEEG